MPLAVLVHGSGPDVPALQGSDAASSGMDLASDERALVLDAPKIVLGRGESCDVRLPHPSVSVRHAVLKTRGSDWVLVDEGSTNGTRTEGLVLPAAVPQKITSRTLFRLGKVWVEVAPCAAPPTRSPRERAKEIALGLVRAELEAHGEEPMPVVTVESGPDAGTSFKVESTTVVGRSKEVDVSLADADVSRRHLEITRRGDVLAVRDLGSKAGSAIDEAPLGSTDVVWRAGQSLVLGGTALAFSFAAADALRERERAPDAKVPHAELDYQKPPPPPEPEPEPAIESTTRALMEEPVEEEEAPRYRGTSWNVTDVAVALLALGVCSLSAVGYLVLLR